MTLIYSFNPIEDKYAETLILGSMPGQASLAAGQYYAHNRNAFWLIISNLLQIDPAASYETKVQAMKSARIALWDVLRSCKRTGSLDAGIETDTLTINDFRTFFQTHTKIKRVFFNGAKAETCFNQHILRHTKLDSISLTRLPSTSPANATVSFAHKLAAWRLILDD